MYFYTYEQPVYTSENQHYENTTAKVYNYKHTPVLQNSSNLKFKIVINHCTLFRNFTP